MRPADRGHRLRAGGPDARSDLTSVGELRRVDFPWPDLIGVAVEPSRPDTGLSQMHRVNLGRPVRALGERNPRLRAVTWSAGPPVRTRDVVFRYEDPELLLWRVRWASLERAIRSGDDRRVARLAAESAIENQRRNRNVDLALLKAAVSHFGAAGFAVAHTGTYHVALFESSTLDREISSYTAFVLANTTDDLDANDVGVFVTGQPAS